MRDQAAGAPRGGIVQAGISLAILGAALLAAPPGAAGGDLPVDYESYLAHLAAAHGALRLDDAAGARRWLDAVPAVRRGWEWRHLDALADRSLAAHPRAHASAVAALAWAPDGAALATAATDGTAILWDASRPLAPVAARELHGHEGEVTTIAFSPDGSLVATGSADRTVRLWERVTGAPVRVLEGHGSKVWAVAFDPAGSRLASSSFERREGVVVGIVHLWDPATGERIGTLEAGSAPISSLAFSPDGRLLAAGSWRYPVYLFDTATGAVAAALEGHEAHVEAVAFGPAGDLVASAADDGTVRVWDVAARAERFVLEGHRGMVKAVAFSPDGRWIGSASLDHTVRLWDVATGEQAAVLLGGTSGARALGFRPDGSLLASGGVDGSLRIWSGRAQHYRRDRWRHEPAAYAVVADPAGERVATASYAGTIELRRLATGEVVATLAGHGDGGDHEANSVNALAFRPDGRVLASGSNDRTVRLWDLAAAGDPAILSGHRGSVVALRFSGDGTRLASASYDGTARIWEPASGAALAVFEHGAALHDVALSADGKRLFTAGGDGRVRLWDAGGGGADRVLAEREPAAYSVDLSPDGALLAISWADGRVTLTTADGRERWSRVGHDSAPYRLRFSPDGARLASGAEHLVLWDVEAGEPLLRLRPHGATIWHLSFTADGTRLLSCSWDGSVAVTDSVRLADRLEERRAARAAVPGRVAAE